MADRKATAEPRSWTGDVPVYCAYDELVDTASLVGNPRNPNTHPAEQVKLLGKIIRSTGWRNSVTVSRRSGFIVKGHGRQLAAALEGIPQCPVEYQDYASEAEEWADLTADNRLAELAETDDAKLADLLAEIEHSDVPLDLAGYTEDDLEKLLDELAGEDPVESTGVDVPYDQPLPPMTKPGDLWILGRHRLVCGDATDPATIERLMDGQKAHMVHTDPPYGVSYTGNVRGQEWEMIHNDDLTGDDLMGKLLIPVFNNYRKHTVPRAAFYVWYAFTSQRDFEDALMAANLTPYQQIIWAKPGGFDRVHYHWAHEPCFYCGKDGEIPDYYGDRKQQTIWRATTDGENGTATVLGSGIELSDGAGHRLYVAPGKPKGKKARMVRVQPGRAVDLVAEDQENTVWEVARETGTLHPTQKPVELPRRAIENSSQPGEIVLDFFGGSGSTLLAAEITGRRCFSAELDPVYCDVAISRYVFQSHDCEAVCIRDGKELRYLDLVRQWAIDNGMAEEIALLRYPVVVIKKIVPAGQQAAEDAQGGE